MKRHKYKREEYLEDEVWLKALQICLGVEYLHSKQIVHRDLKLENALLTNDKAPRLKICDFGYSKSGLLHSQPKSTVGTPAYIGTTCGWGYSDCNISIRRLPTLFQTWALNFPSSPSFPCFVCECSSRGAQERAVWWKTSWCVVLWGHALRDACWPVSFWGSSKPKKL